MMSIPASLSAIASALVIAAGLAAGAATAADSTARFSTDLGMGSVTIVDGSLTMVRGSGQIVGGSLHLVVDSAQVVGDSVIVVLSHAGEASAVVLKGATDSLGILVNAVGTGITAIVTAAGHILYWDGEVVGFVPNEAGSALAHSSRHGELR